MSDQQTSHSLARQDTTSQPVAGQVDEPGSCNTQVSETSSPAESLDTNMIIERNRFASPNAHVVLFQPEIPQNTGNIGRTCVATDSVLWIVKPIPFQIDQRQVRRAGLDYWPHLDLRLVDHWNDLKTQLPEADGRRYWYFSRFARRSIWDARFARGDVLVFGSETSGLPASIREQAGPQALRLPTTREVRSLNLANTVAVAVYELLRQLDTAAE